MKKRNNGDEPTLFDLPGATATPPPPRPTGRELGHEGAKIAADHADRENDGDWQTRAAYLLGLYQKTGVREFKNEDFRAFALSRGLPEPPDRRAFGAVILRAKKNGLIRHLRYGRVDDPIGHAHPVSIWGWI